MKTYWSGRSFNPVLRKSSLLSWILKLLPIPGSLITAQTLSEIVNCASQGDVRGVLSGGSFLLLFVLTVKLMEVTIGIAFEKTKAGSVQCCKLKLYQIFLANPLQILFGARHGSSIEKLNDDFDKVTQKGIKLYPELGSGILTTVIFFMFLCEQNGAIAFILLGLSLLQIIPPMLIKRFLQVNYDNCREIEAKLTDFTISGLRGFAEIKLYDLKGWWLEKLKGYHKDYSRIGSASIYAATAENTLKNFISTILQYGTYAILGLLLLNGYAEMDVCVETIALSGSFFAAVETVFSSIPQLAVTKTAQERLEEWFEACRFRNVDLIQGTDDVSNHQILNNSVLTETADIKLHDVSYTVDEKPILKNTSVTFSTERIGLIKGENGIGKSTLFRLILGLVSDYEGEITSGEVFLKEIPEVDFHANIFYLPQEDALFSVTPKKLYEMAAKDRLSKCLENAYRFGLSSKEIEETQIDELSGGERKKVYLAMALADEQIYLLLDEPTNGLDEVGKRVLSELLKKRKGGALIITHDPALDAAADECYVIRNQKINIMKGGSVCEARG